MKKLLIITAIIFLIACGPDTGPEFPTNIEHSSSSSYRYYSSSSSSSSSIVPDPNYCPSGEQKITSSTFNDGRCGTESKAFADKWSGLCTTTGFIDCVNTYKCQGGPAVSRTCGSL